MINGYASVPGTAEANYILSFQRATAVARCLEASGIPESVADHRGSRGHRRGRFGGLGREPAGAGGHRGAARQGLSCCRHGPREPALSPAPGPFAG